MTSQTEWKLVPVEHLTALVAFARWAISEGPWEGCNLDGGGIQDKATELGLLVRESYDPEKHGPNAEFESGDDWFTFSPMLAAAPEPSDEIVEKGALASELPEHLIERLEKWLREPDWSERCDLDWLLDWVNRRPLDAIAALRAIKATQGGVVP